MTEQGASIRAMTFDRQGAPDVFEMTEHPVPTPLPGQVAINVVAAGVNRSDVMERGGGFYPPRGRTLVGLECSGYIAQLGEGVTGWQVGDPVAALLNQGGYAETVVAEAGQLLPVPPGISMVDAAALVEVSATVLSNFDIARLEPGETLLVHGGASGIGTFAIQLARELGVRTIVTVGSEAKAEFCRQLGADQAIVYRTSDFVDGVRDATDSHGADVILDNMGASYLERNIEALAVGGRLVIIGFQGGVTTSIDLWRLWQKRGSVHTTALRTRPVAEKSAIIARVRDVVWPLVVSGRIRAIVDRTLPLAEAAEAHRVLEASEHIGKIILVTERSATGAPS